MVAMMSKRCRGRTSPGRRRPLSDRRPFCFSHLPQTHLGESGRKSAHASKMANHPAAHLFFFCCFCSCPRGRELPVAGDSSHKASEMSSHYQYLQPQTCREAVNKTPVRQWMAEREKNFCLP